jgi:Fic family protein
MSRLLTTLLLYRAGYVVGKYISLESKIAKNKGVYYDVLEECQQGWHQNEDNPTPFIKYMLKIILAAYRDFEERIDIVGNKHSAIELVKKAVYNKIGKFTKNDIMEMCPTIGKTSVESSLKKLCRNGEIVKCGSGRTTFYVRSDAF